jgi:hypothetical protein
MIQQLRPLPAFLVFLSGYWPLALVILALDWDWDKLEFGAPWTVGAVVAGFVISCAFTVWHFNHYQTGQRVKVISAKDRSVELLNYAVPYIAGFATMETDRLGHVIAMLVVLWVVFYITYKTHTVVVNPFLLSLGYRLLDLEYERTDKTRGEVMAVSRWPIEASQSVRLRSIATSCALVVAIVPDAETSS